MADNRVRPLGSGFTVFRWEKRLVGFANEVTIQSPQPVAQAVPIQPLNAQRPLEIITAGAHGPGTITLNLTELYNRSVWQRLAHLARSQDIVDIMRQVASLNQGIELMKVVRPHHQRNAPSYHETFYNCVITAVEDGETINVATMEVHKPVTIMFTHSRKSWINGGRYLFARDVRTG